MSPDPIRWVVLKGRVEARATIEKQRLAFETVAVVDSERGAEASIELHMRRSLP